MKDVAAKVAAAAEAVVDVALAAGAAKRYCEERGESETRRGRVCLGGVRWQHTPSLCDA